MIDEDERQVSDYKTGEVAAVEMRNVPIGRKGQHTVKLDIPFDEDWVGETVHFERAQSPSGGNIHSFTDEHYDVDFRQVGESVYVEVTITDPHDHNDATASMVVTLYGDLDRAEV